jgi:hypothetical protein
MVWFIWMRCEARIIETFILNILCFAFLYVLYSVSSNKEQSSLNCVVTGVVQTRNRVAFDCYTFNTEESHVCSRRPLTTGQMFNYRPANARLWYRNCTGRGFCHSTYVCPCQHHSSGASCALSVYHRRYTISQIGTAIKSHTLSCFCDAFL